MRSNTENMFLFDCFEIKYALLGCLSFTSETEKLTQMLLYVLFCTAVLNEKFSKKLTKLNIIDGITDIIGADYANCKNYPPAKDLYSLGADTRMILFKYMIGSPGRAQDRHFDKLSAKLRIAQQKLKEKLDFEYGYVGNNRFFEPKAYLSLISEHLTHRLNEISMSIAKELYQQKKTFLNRELL